jgi:hypothetical protein
VPWYKLLQSVQQQYKKSRSLRNGFMLTKTNCCLFGRGWFQLTHPYFFALDSSHEEHNAYEDEEEGA